MVLGSGLVLILKDEHCEELEPEGNWEVLLGF